MTLSWVGIALLGYLFLAVTGVADKFLVSKIVRQPVAYAFYTAMTGPFSLLLLLFGGTLPNIHNLIVALLAGTCFIIGIFYSYSAIRNSSVSRVVPIQGGLVPVFTFLAAYLMLGERLSGLAASGFFFLVLGAVMISFRKENGVWTSQAFMYAALSSLFFALTSVLTKYTFVHASDVGAIHVPSFFGLFGIHVSTGFVTGLVWPSIGFIIPIPFILAFKKNRQAIFNAPKEAGVKNIALYYTSRAFGTVGGYLQKYAVFLGSVSVVNALQGMQFVFLLILTTFFSIYFPKVLKERVDTETIVLKLTAIVFISCGLFLLIR